jgi:uncharacterized membrane protein (DUF2068 family)
VGFIRQLLTIVFVAMGVLGILSVLYGATTLELTAETLMAIALGTLAIAAGYGLYAGKKWGWALAALLTVLNMFSAYTMGSMYILAFNLIVLVLLLMTAREFTVRLPSPALPKTAAGFAFVEEKRHFVKRKRE